MSGDVEGYESSLTKNAIKALSTNEKAITDFPCDESSIPQLKLDLNNRYHTNFFLWRGQFSPELVEIFLSSYAKKDSVILDPFVGSGTTLFECAYQSLTAYGSDVNPSAYELSKTAQFANVKIHDRLEIIKQSEQIIKDILPDEFSYVEKQDENIESPISKEHLKLILEASTNCGEYVRSFNLNVIMRYSNINNSKIKNKLIYAFNTHKNLVMRNIPFILNKIKALHNDARSISLEDNSIDLTITSPPYINVFNYHQNYREVMELYRNDILEIAKSEIGSNRKNRHNRFRSVIQYSIDMCDCLNEIKRLLKKQGRIILIIGRQSKIKGTHYDNYKIIYSIATLCSGLKLISRQQRQYQSRFGKETIEDILHFQIENNESPIVTPKDVGKYYLLKSLKYTAKSNYDAILNTLNGANEIKPSPLLFEYT